MCIGIAKWGPVEGGMGGGSILNAVEGMGVRTDRHSGQILLGTGRV